MRVQEEVTHDGVVFLISTVRLPSLGYNDHEFPFETMVFFDRFEDPNVQILRDIYEIETVGNLHDLYAERYKTETEALSGHSQAVDLVKQGYIKLPDKH